MSTRRKHYFAGIDSLEARRLMSGTTAITGATLGGVNTITGATLSGVNTISGATFAGITTNTAFVRSADGLVLYNGTGTFENIQRSGDAPVTANGVVMRITSKGTLLVEGTTANNNISVSTNKKSFTVSAFGAASVFFSRADVKRIQVEGGAGKDTLSFTGSHTDVPVSLLGGDGNDTLRSSAGCTLIGGAGDDVLDGGNSGVTVFSTGSNTNTIITQGEITKSPIWQPATGQLIIGSTTDLDTGSLMLGGDGDDTITATAGPDTISGGHGNDAIVKSVFGDTKIPVGDDLSPGDQVDSIEFTQFKVASTTASTNVYDVVNGVVTFHPSK